MKVQWLLVGASFLLLSGCAWLSFLQKDINWREQAKPDLSKVKNWVTYYGPYSSGDILSELNRYDMVVVGWMDYSQPKIKKPIVIQYLSVVEAGANHRKYYDWLDGIDESYRLFDNPDYPGAWVIDIRKQAWQDLIIEKAIPWTMDHGGRGLMLDTFGNISLYLGNRGDFREAAIRLIKRIRTTYPNLVLLINEPGDLLPDIYQYIDGSIFEQYMADIRTGEIFSKPRINCACEDVKLAIQLRDSLPVEKNLLLLTCDMVKNNDLQKSTVCINRALADGMLPSLTPYSSLGKRYQTLSDQYWKIMNNK